MATADQPSVLGGEKIHIAEGHFNDSICGLLRHLIQEVGAEHVDERRDATIVITNPVSPAFKGEKERIAALIKSTSGPLPFNVPYHWLSLCQHRKTRVETSSKTHDKPIFVNDGQPLRTWVSLNVSRRKDEQPNVAHEAVVELLVQGGALIVKKRAQADVLVIDPYSNFYQTVKEEKEKHRRDHQVLKEREWVEDCSRNKVVSWAQKEEAKTEDEGEESFAEEEMPVKNGPGRPAGKARQDYTAKDDDLLQRYLAFHYPEGSWRSRKTFEVMCADRDKYSWVLNHSPQSWHERFKKNQVPFSKRVENYVRAGVDEKLETRDDRAMWAAARAGGSGAVPAVARSSARAQQGDTKSAIATSAPSGTQQPAKVQQREGAPTGVTGSSDASAVVPPRPMEKMKRSNGKRALVNSDDEAEPGPSTAPPAASSTAQLEHVSTTLAPVYPSAGDAASTSRQPAASQLSPAPSQPHPIPPAAHASSQPIPSASQSIPAPQPPASIPQPSSRPQQLQGDSVIVEQSLSIDADVEMTDYSNPGTQDHATQTDAPETQRAVESQESQKSSSSDIAVGAETQAILSDFARMKALAKARQAEVVQAAPVPVPAPPPVANIPTSTPVALIPAHPAPAVEVIHAESSTHARATSLPRSPRPSADQPPSKRPRHTEPIQQTGFPPRSDMPAPRSVSRLPRVSQASDGSGKQRISMPVEMHFRVVGVTQDGSTEESGEEDVRPRRNNRLSLAGEVSTPRARDHLQKRVSSSVAGSSRRQSRRHQSPDTVYASPAIPPRLPPPPPSDSPSIAGRNGRKRASPSPITQRELERSILDGQQVAAQQAQTFLANIRRLRNKYGATPNELHKALDSTMAPGEVSLPAWDEIERRLDEFYQYAG